MNDEYFVRMVQFPGDIHGAIRIDEDGFASIYINDNLSREARLKAFLHEYEHFLRNDMSSEDEIYDVEHRGKHKSVS